MRQWIAYPDDPRAAGVQVLAGQDRLSGIPSKPGMICLCDSIWVRHVYNLTNAAAANELYTDHICRRLNGIEIQRAPGVGGDHLVAPMALGEFVLLQSILDKRRIVQPFVINAGAVGRERVPLWKSRYPWDIDAYPTPVNELQTVRYTRGGATLMVEGTDVAQLGAEGRFVPAGTVDAPGFVYRPRSWFAVQTTTATFTLPGGWRYHAIFVVNMGGADANRFDGGLNIQAANASIMNIDGEDMQQMFVDEYQINDHTFMADLDTANGAGNSPVTPAALGAASFIHNVNDYIQPIYAPLPESIRYEDGLIGPVTVQIVAANDPQTNNVFCCACPM